MSKKKKRIILFSALAGIVVALVIVYFTVILPLTKEEEKPFVEPTVEEGEGKFYGLLTMYPQIEYNNVNSISIKNQSGEFKLVNQMNEVTGLRRLSFEGYPNLPNHIQ